MLSSNTQSKKVPSSQDVPSLHYRFTRSWPPSILSGSGAFPRRPASKQSKTSSKCLCSTTIVWMWSPVYIFIGFWLQIYSVLLLRQDLELDLFHSFDIMRTVCSWHIDVEILSMTPWGYYIRSFPGNLSAIRFSYFESKRKGTKGREFIINLCINRGLNSILRLFVLCRAPKY